MSAQGKVSEVVSHPVRLRVLQALGGRQLTTAQLREALPDIAQATLYRHVAALVDGGYLAVVSERRARGAVERTYALGERMAHIDEQELATMSEDQLRATFLAFIQELTRTFDAAAARTEDGRRLLGFGTSMIYVDEDDLGRIQQQFTQTLEPYLQEAAGKRRLALSSVLLPVD